MNAEIILTAMLSLPPYTGDRGDTPAARAELYRPVAEAIAEVAPGNPTKAAALVALAYAETKFARYVLTGNCASGPPGMRCDNGRARGAFQVWAWCDAWRHPEGSPESLRAEARCAARALAAGKRRCLGRHPAGDWAAMFSGYRGPACSWPPAARRARSMLALEARLR